MDNYEALLASLEAEAMVVPQEDIELVQGMFGDKGSYSIDVLENITRDDFEPYLKRVERVKKCGKLTIFRLAISGFPYRVPVLCGAFRVCQVCLESRADKYSGRVANAIVEHGAVRIVHTSSWDAACIKRGLGKNEYVCFPQADGDTVLVMIPDENLPGDLVDDVDGINWLEVSRTPEGKRVSGSLGKIDKHGIVVNTQNISFKNVDSDEDHELIYNAYADAIDKVAGEVSFEEATPDNVEPIEEGLNELARRWALNVEFATMMSDSEVTVNCTQCEIRVSLDEITRIIRNKKWDANSLVMRFCALTEKNKLIK